MAAFTSLLLGLGTALSVAGTAVSAYGQSQAIEAQKESERIRRNAMIIDSQRKRREIIRQTQVVRAQNVAQATGQGAAGSGSSALPGNYGGIMGRAATDTRGVYTAQVFGQQIFDQNAKVTSAQGLSAFGGTIASVGSGISSLSGSISGVSDAANRVNGGSGGTVGGTSGATYESDPWAGIR